MSNYKDAVNLFQDCFKRIATKQKFYWTIPNDIELEEAINCLIDAAIERMEENKKTEAIKESKEDKYTLEHINLIARISSGKSVDDFYFVENDSEDWRIVLAEAPVIVYSESSQELSIYFKEKNCSYRDYIVPVSKLGKKLFTNIKEAKKALRKLEKEKE